MSSTIFFPTGLVAGILILVSGYTLFQSFKSIANIKKYESRAEKAAEWSDTAGKRLWETRYTIGAGFVSVSPACPPTQVFDDPDQFDSASFPCSRRSPTAPSFRAATICWPLPGEPSGRPLCLPGSASDRQGTCTISGLPRPRCPCLTSTTLLSPRAWRSSVSWRPCRSGGPSWRC